MGAETKSKARRSEKRATARTAGERKSTASAQRPVPPRPHHFEFAHAAVPEFAYRGRQRFLDALARRPGEYANHLWQYVGDILRQQGEEPMELHNPLSVEKRAVGGLCCYVIHMPEPRAVPEAVLVVIVYREGEGAAESLAVYTVDKSYEPPLLTRRVWPDGRATIQGYFDEPDVERLLAAIQEDYCRAESDAAP